MGCGMPGTSAWWPLKKSTLVQEASLSYAGKQSTYEGQFLLPEAGTYEVQVVAMDPQRGDFGVVQRLLTVVR